MTFKTPAGDLPVIISVAGREPGAIGPGMYRRVIRQWLLVQHVSFPVSKGLCFFTGPKGYIQPGSDILCAIDIMSLEEALCISLDTDIAGVEEIELAAVTRDQLEKNAIVNQRRGPVMNIMCIRRDDVAVTAHAGGGRSIPLPSGVFPFTVLPMHTPGKKDHRN